jgi:hypothetical protein
MAVSVSVSGSFKNTQAFLAHVSKLDILGILNANGRLGVAALARATPIDSSVASNSWGFEANKKGGVYSLIWTNTDVENGFPVVIMLQYGYGTGTGGYVQGRDFINPAIRPVFDEIADKVWKAVTSG